MSSILTFILFCIIFKISFFILSYIILFVISCICSFKSSTVNICILTNIVLLIISYIVFFIIFLKNRPKIRFLWKYVEPPNAIFKKLDFEIYDLNNRWYSQNRLKKSVCPIDFLNLRSTAKCPHQQKERFFSAAANPWDFWSPAGNHKNRRFLKGS